MLFQAEKNDLHRLLRSAAMVAPKRSTKIINTCLLVEADAAVNEVSVTANSGEEIFTSKIAANVTEGGKVAVVATDIVSVAKALPVGIVEVSLGESSRKRDDPKEGETSSLAFDEDRALPLVLKGGKAKISLETLPASEFPRSNWESEDVSPARMGAGDILRLINHTLYAASLEETRYYLGGCYFQVIDGDLVVTATDGHRLAQARTAWDESMALICNAKSSDEGAILSRTLLNSLAKLLESNKALGAEFQIVARKVAWFESGDVRIQGALVDGSYPDWRQVIPKTTNIQVLFNRVTLMAALERVALLSPDKSGGVRFDLCPDGGDESATGHLMVSSQHTGRGQAQQAVDVVDMGTPFGEIAMGLNAHYLLNALKVMDSAAVQISFVNHLSPIMLHPSSLEGEVDVSEMHIVMPMRL